jgi:hypothetical protein
MDRLVISAAGHSRLSDKDWRTDRVTIRANDRSSTGDPIRTRGAPTTMPCMVFISIVPGNFLCQELTVVY